jgi:U3 small nucleolar ribonucleoprotein protein IMP4
MLRRNARLRKEFLYRKSLEGKERELYEKKRKIREALEGAPSPPPSVVIAVSERRMRLWVALVALVRPGASHRYE